MEVKKNIIGLLGIVVFIIMGVLVISEIAGAANSVTQNVTVKVLPADLFVSSPVNDMIYTSRIVLVEANTMGFLAKYIKYNDNNGLVDTILCRNCNSVSKKKSFNDGPHELFFSAELPQGIIYQNVHFWVDSRAPVIKKTSPNKGFGVGEFILKFYEVNPKYINLTYGNDVVGFRIKEVPLTSCSEDRNTWECKTEVDLMDYDLQEVSYWFSVYDIASHSAFSKIRTIDVDLSSPIIENINYSINKKEVSFVIDIDELNFKVASYTDKFASKPEKVVLCRKLKNGQCVAKKRFTSGSHNLTIEVEDKVGHSANSSISFKI
jgi:hypothetical protein